MIWAEGAEKSFVSMPFPPKVNGPSCSDGRTSISPWRVLCWCWGKPAGAGDRQPCQHSPYPAGGSAGSGKSVLLKLLLMQALQKGAEVYIADFKGGVDFPRAWHERCKMCFTEANLLQTLDHLVAIQKERSTLFSAAGPTGTGIWCSSDLRHPAARRKHHSRTD